MCSGRRAGTSRTASRHADRPFLERSVRLADVVYSFHNGETEAWVESTLSDLGARPTDRLPFAFPIPHTFDFHSKESVDVPVTLFRIVRDGANR